MASEWFYTRDGKSKSGPLSSAQLQALAKSGQLQPADMVWKEGMARWTPTSKIKGLFPSAANPPKLRKQSATSSTIPTTHKGQSQSPQLSEQSPSDSDEPSEASEHGVGRGKVVLGLVAFAAVASVAGVIVLMAVFMNSGTHQDTLAQNKKDPQSDPKDKASAEKEPTVPDPPPVITSQKLFEKAETLIRDKRIVGTGLVQQLKMVSINERIFWKLPKELSKATLGYASLTDNLNADRPQVNCVFRNGLPALLKEGAPCRIEGTFLQVNSISGIPLLVDCEVAAEMPKDEH